MISTCSLTPCFDGSRESCASVHIWQGAPSGWLKTLPKSSLSGAPPTLLNGVLRSHSAIIALSCGNERITQSCPLWDLPAVLSSAANGLLTAGLPGMPSFGRDSSEANALAIGRCDWTCPPPSAGEDEEDCSGGPAVNALGTGGPCEACSGCDDDPAAPAKALWIGGLIEA